MVLSPEDCSTGITLTCVAAGECCEADQQCGQGVATPTHGCLATAVPVARVGTHPVHMHFVENMPAHLIPET